MKRQNVIVVIAPTLEVWGNFRKLCVAKGFDKRTTMKPNNPTAEHVLKDIKDFVDDMDVIVGEELDDLWNKGIKYATSHFRRILLKYQYEL